MILPIIGTGFAKRRLQTMKVKGIGVLATLVAVTACTTLDPYTREEQTARAQRNALIGAAAGAVAGLITGDSSMERKKRALVGAGLGALAGGSVGAYMDRQEARLRQELDRTGVSVTRIGNNITLNMPGNITFATDSADLNADFYDVLNSVALVVDEFEQTVIEVAGHTDSTGTAAYNQQLSERRAASVAAYLRTRGVRGDRIIEVGEGEERPIADNSTPEGRQANRRVELTLVPLSFN
jgi:outer membrane protein OmpA-like peptidoglycan-associated protein